VILLGQYLLGLGNHLIRVETWMASKARNAFDENMEDVARLLALHEGAGVNGPGRRYGLEVLNKSAVVLLTPTGNPTAKTLRRRH
jgi:hypothetical protein